MLKLQLLSLSNSKSESHLVVPTVTPINNDLARSKTREFFITAEVINKSIENLEDESHLKNRINVYKKNDGTTIHLLFSKEHDKLLYEKAFDVTLSQRPNDEIALKLTNNKKTYQIRLYLLSDQIAQKTIIEFYNQNPAEKIHRFAKDLKLSEEDATRLVVDNGLIETTYYIAADGTFAKAIRICSIFKDNRPTLSDKNPLVNYYESTMTSEDFEIIYENLLYIRSALGLM